MSSRGTNDRLTRLVVKNPAKAIHLLIINKQTNKQIPNNYFGIQTTCPFNGSHFSNADLACEQEAVGGDFCN